VVALDTALVVDGGKQRRSKISILSDTGEWSVEDRALVPESPSDT